MYLVIWRYRIHPQHRDEFEAVYSCEGEWAQLFRKFEGHIRTELLHDKTTGEYMTIDYWRDIDTYTSFHNAGHQAYKDLDDKCERFTEKETFVGAFSQERSDARW